MPATRLYLRNLTAANPPTAGEKSTALPVDTLGANNASGTDETRALKTAKGAAQTSLAKNSDNVTAARDNYLARFTSDALAAQTIAAQTWTLALALSEANANANSFLIASIYVWRPSTTAVVGFIYDSHTSLGIEWGATEDGQVVTVSGSAVTTQANDVLVFEVWRHAAQGMATAYAQTLYFEGTTDVTDTTTTDAASYIQDTNGLTFGLSPTRGLVSWAELETPFVQTRGLVSWSELEAPFVGTRGLVSWAETETPLAPTRGLVSWTELEAPIAPTRGLVSWVEQEVPSVGPDPTRGLLSWAELEAPFVQTRGQVSWAELETPLSPTRGQISWAEIELPLAPTRGLLSWTELEAPTTPTRGLLSWAELELPVAATRGLVSWAELELPELGGTAARPIKRISISIGLRL